MDSKKPTVEKCVLAYSGGLDTSVILKWLCEKGFDVHEIGWHVEGNAELGFHDMVGFIDLTATIVDAAKVTRSALQNAASIAALFLTTEAIVADVTWLVGAGTGAHRGRGRGRRPRAVKARSRRRTCRRRRRSRRTTPCADR